MGAPMGGFLNEVSREGDVVRRRALVPLDRSFGERVLEQLSAAGFDAAPQFLGHDADGAQLLSYVEGESRPNGALDAELPLVLRTVRRFHDLCPGVCHNDLAPRNTVWRRADRAPVFIDWDDCAPGRPIEDIAHACWQFVRLGPTRTVEELGPVLRQGLDAYGLEQAGRAASSTRSGQIVSGCSTTERPSRTRCR